MSLESGAVGSIRRRLLLFLLPSLLALMIVGVFMNYRVAMLVVGSASDQRLADEARAIAARISAADGKLREEPASALASSSALAPSTPSSAQVMTYSVRGPRGQFLGGNPSVTAAPSGGENPSFADGVLGGDAVRVATYRVPTSLGAITVNVAEPSAQRSATGHVIVTSTWLIDFVQVDVTLLLVWIAVHYGLRPLLALRREIEARSVRDLEPLRGPEVPSEVRPLVDAINLLFDMLREAARSQRQFVADTAHQLRTPLAGFLGHLEVLMREPAATPMRDQLAMLHEGMSRLAHSANQLLTLARADPTASVTDRFESVALDSLAEKVVELHVNRAVESGHDLGVELQSARVTGNPRLLEDLLGNLVDNALGYTPAGSRVTVRSGLSDGKPYLEVEDDGPGIPEVERSRVRQRFYRIPGTRGRGCGLGLAIVEEISRLHDAALSLDAGSGGRGTQARVAFRAAAS